MDSMRGMQYDFLGGLVGACMLWIHKNFPFKIQTKLDNSLIINFSSISLYQDVKRKQALLRSNLPAINILTVRSNATWGGGKTPLFLYY